MIINKSRLAFESPESLSLNLMFIMYILTYKYKMVIVISNLLTCQQCKGVKKGLKIY